MPRSPSPDSTVANHFPHNYHSVAVSRWQLSQPREPGGSKLSGIECHNRGREAELLRDVTAEGRDHDKEGQR
jgi:hypothetical protein